MYFLNLSCTCITNFCHYLCCICKFISDLIVSSFMTQINISQHMKMLSLIHILELPFSLKSNLVNISHHPCNTRDVQIHFNIFQM